MRAPQCVSPPLSDGVEFPAQVASFLVERCDPLGEVLDARIKPVGDVNLVQGDAPGAPVDPGTATPVAPAPTAAPAAATRSGEEVYQLACAMCHGAGLAGAPKLRDAAAWKPRIAQGQAVLHENAIKGIRAMPAKGGNPSLSDAEVSAAVDYMASAAK